MALAMKALPGLQAKLAGSRVTAARQNCSIRRLPVQQRIVSVATASADAPQTDAEKEQILKEIEQVNAELTAAGVESEFLAVWDDEADEAEEGEAEIVDINDPRLADEDIGDEDYEGPEAIVQTLYNDDTETFMGTEVLYDFDGELVKDSPEAEAFLKEEYPSWFADAEEVVEETENVADEEDEEGEADYDEGEMDETDLAEREELMSAMEKRDEALTLLKSWTPEMLEELYPNGKVPGFNKKQSKDLWRALRYFLAVEAVDAAYEVQNLGAEGGDVVELDDDNDFEEEDADEDTAADVALYEEYDALAREFDIAVNPKDRVYGTVYRVTEDGAYVELPGKCSGYVPLSECSVAKLSSPTEVLVVGTKREFVVLEVDDVYGEVILSLRAMEWDVLWRRVQQLQEEDVTVYVTVTDFNNGGLTVDYQGIEGFIPIAQFGNKLQLETMEELVGVQVPCKIFEASQEDERIVFSNKRAISDGYSQTFNPGDVLSGVIQSVKTYGAFVDLGGVTGLLHISQISNDRVMDVSKVFSEGDKLKVMVLSTDKDRGRVTLSTKKLEATPGDMIRAPDLVYEKAEEIAAQFKERMGAANDLSGNPAEFDPAYDTMGSVVQGYAGNTGYEYQEGYDYQAAGQQVAGEEQPPQDAQQ